MLPLTNKEIKLKRCLKCWSFWTIRHFAIFFSLYGVVSTLLLPLTLRGPLGGQYGMVISSDNAQGRQELLSLTDVSFALEMFLISLLFFAHLIGFISVYKESTIGIVFYLFVLLLETYLSACWFASANRDTIKSHVMSQDSLQWFCLVSFAIKFISLFGIMTFAMYEDKSKLK